MLSLFRIALLFQFLQFVRPFSSPPFVETNICDITSTQLHVGESRIYSKERSKVVLDPETGFYRPAPKLPFKKKAAKKGPNLWNAFKNALYGGVDGIQAIPKVIPLGGGEEEKGVVDGYEQVQQKIYGSSSPGKRLLREYEERGPTPPVGGKAQGSLFDSVKGAVYGTFDAAGNLATSTEESQQEQIESFKPIVRSSLGASEDIQTSLSELNSNNPVRKIIAKNKIRDFEKKELEMQEAIERHKKSRQAKEIVYKVVDVSKSTAEGLSKLPQLIYGAYETTRDFFSSIPGITKRAVDTVVAIPDEIQRKAEDVQKSVDNSVETAKQVVETVKSIPNKVKETADSVKETAYNAADTVDETVQKGKVLLGVEKEANLKPRPPNTPPPKPLTAKEIGWKVAGGVASVGTKVAWFAGKSLAFITWKGAKLAFEKGQEALQEQHNATVAASSSLSMSSKSDVATASTVESSPPKTVQIKKPASVSQEDIISAEAKRAAEVQPSAKKKQKELDREVEGTSYCFCA